MISVMLIALIVVPGVVGWLLYLIHPLSNDYKPARWNIGDPIVYRVQKDSSHPGQRARNIHPATLGETYTYLVDKFWAVEDVLDDGRIVAITRTRKHHYINPDDLNLRKPGAFERLRHRNRFPQLTIAQS